MLAPIAAQPEVELQWADAMKLDLAALAPAPTAVVSNLPYSVATPVILRTVVELPSVQRWTVMVQREIADRLRAEPGSRVYGSPSVLVQFACEVRLLRTVDPAVFRPRPRVESAILALRRTGPGADEATRELVRGAFAHRRKALARSLEHVRPGRSARRARRWRRSGCPKTLAPRRWRPRNSPRCRQSCVLPLRVDLDADPRPRQAQPLPLPRAKA